jgi:hypothetical protein
MLGERGLGGRILLASGFDAHEYSRPHQYQAADDDPVRWHVQQDGAVDQSDDYNREADDVDCE